MEPSLLKSRTIQWAVFYGLAAALLLFVAAFCTGLSQGKVVSTLSLIGTSLLLEAQPSAVASIPLGFHPLVGAVVSILANLIPIPLLMLTFNEIVNRWKWANRKLHKAEKWSLKYGRYGVWILVPLSPFLGAYVCIAIGFAMRWRPLMIFSTVTLGMVASTFLISYGGHWAVRLFG